MELSGPMAASLRSVDWIFTVVVACSYKITTFRAEQRPKTKVLEEGRSNKYNYKSNNKNNGQHICIYRIL